MVAEADPVEMAKALAAWRSKEKPEASGGFTWREWSTRYLRKIDCSERHKEALGLTVRRVPWQTIPIAQVGRERVEAWIDASKWSAATKRTYLAHVSEIFSAAVSAGHLKDNPCVPIEKPRARQIAVRIYSPDEANRLLKIALEYRRDMVPALAVAMFAGLRPQSELARLDWRDVRTAEGIIVVHSTKVRSASRRIVPILPALAEWLLFCGVRSSGPVVPRGFEQARKRMCAAHKFAWIPDGLRHSFASYRLADCEDAAKVALELGHANTRMLFQHYRAVCTRAEAEAF